MFMYKEKKIDDNIKRNKKKIPTVLPIDYVKFLNHVFCGHKFPGSTRNLKQTRKP